MNIKFTNEQQIKIEKIMRETLNIDEKVDIKTITSENNAAWDSLSHVALSLRLQDEFEVQLSGAELIGMRSYSDIINTLSIKFSKK